jgi:hypothetical protein
MRTSVALPVIKLGPRVGVRKVSVRLQWPDGRPAASTNVSAEVNGKIAELAKTGSTGTLELVLLNGVEYSFSGRAWTSYRLVNGSSNSFFMTPIAEYD